MSVIADYMIVFNGWEEEAVTDLNRRLDEIDTERRQQFRQIDMDYAGGSKFFTTNIWAAAFNHLIPLDIDECIAQSPWRHPEEVLVVVRAPDYDIDLHSRTVEQMRAKGTPVASLEEGP